jgi:hypothetical protein
MSAIYERLVLGEIEYNELFHHFEIAKSLKNILKKDQKWKRNSLKNKVFEGTIVAAGWDKYEHVNKASLYTQDDEDILLEHNEGINIFKPYFNQKVIIFGDIISSSKNVRKVIVKNIFRLDGGYTKSLIPPLVELDDREELNEDLISADVQKQLLL